MYKLVYDKISGMVTGVIGEGIGQFGISPENSDFQAFLVWNAEQKVPLDLDSTIPVVVPDPATQQVFELPVVAPDFIVQSPKPKSDPKEAHTEAIKESKKASKSIASIVLNMMVYIEELEKRIDALEKV